MNYFSRLLDRLLEWAFQAQANKQFSKHSVEYRDGDNT